MTCLSTTKPQLRQGAAILQTPIPHWFEEEGGEMAAKVSKDSSIVIVGGGTWACSTALHLVRRGYSNVTVLDAHPIPSSISAGNDVNKIAELGKCLQFITAENLLWLTRG